MLVIQNHLAKGKNTEKGSSYFSYNFFIFFSTVIMFPVALHVCNCCAVVKRTSIPFTRRKKRKVKENEKKDIIIILS